MLVVAVFVRGKYMNPILTAAALFSVLLSHARSPSGIDADRRVSTGELQYALVALEFDNEGVSKQEANIVREVLFKNRRLLTPEAQVAGDLWLARYASAASNRAAPIRRAEAFRRTMGWFEVARGRGGLTAYDMRLLLSLLGTRASPVRALEVLACPLGQPIWLLAEQLPTLASATVPCVPGESTTRGS